MNKNSVILMGVDWSKAAKTKAFKDLKVENPNIARFIESLDRYYRKRFV